MTSRKVEIARKTRETEISLTLDPDAPGGGQVRTGLPFFDHLLASMAFHGRFFLDIDARGDIDVDPHHLVEDVGLVLGQAFTDVLGKSGQVKRFGHAVIPMDEALAQVTIDVCGRPTLVWRVRLPQAWVGAFDLSLLREFFDGLAAQARISLHVEARRGRNSHHIVEAAFKALGRSLHESYEQSGDSMSTKGRIG
ncbi:MAG TPA: imidazoleglycerol-phosphate dehydratase HisB [Spirochaetia bacterium]|nr:imidazoleglycerol-phosphate dehydratase HisB [Spirochaetia bacterium]